MKTKSADTALTLRTGSQSEGELVRNHLQNKWRLAELRLAIAREDRLITIDDQIVGRLGMARGDLSDASFLSDRSSSIDRIDCQHLFDHLRGSDDGIWAIKSGLWLAPDLLRERNRDQYLYLMRLVGPIWAALFAERSGLRGYFAAVQLEYIDRFRPSLNPVGYLQQVKAGSIYDPLLAAHLEYGARPMAIIDDPKICATLLEWRRP